MKKRLQFAVLLLFLAADTVFGQTRFTLKINGEVPHPLELSLSGLSEMTRKEAVLKDKNGATYIYSGVSVQDILAKAGVLTGKRLHGAENLSKYVLIKCSDGYRFCFHSQNSMLLSMTKM